MNTRRNSENCENSENVENSAELGRYVAPIRPILGRVIPSRALVHPTVPGAGGAVPVGDPTGPGAGRGWKTPEGCMPGGIVSEGPWGEDPCGRVVCEGPWGEDPCGRLAVKERPQGPDYNEKGG